MERRFSAPWRLAELIAPVSVEEFCSEYWGRKPLLIQRAAPEFYRDLIRLEDVERYLLVEDVLTRKVARMRRRDYGAFEHPENLETIYAGLLEGKSLQLRKMETFLDPACPILALVRNMELELQHPKESLSCYFTPPDGQSLGPHRDESEIFTLQIEGKKRWRLFHQVHSDQAQIHSRSELGEPVHDFLLESGDLLYHPRGAIHEVTSVGVASFSITIVFAPILWRSMLEILFARLATSPELVEQMPAGILEKEILREGVESRLAFLQRELANFSVDDMIGALLETRRPRLPEPSGSHLRRLVGIQELTLGTVLVRADTQEMNGIPFPEAADPAVQFIRQAVRPFLVLEIPGLSSADQLTFAKILMRDGIVKPADPAP